MSTVDNRVVEMGFNNAIFEQRVAATIASLDKLRASLDFTAAKKNFGDISSAANSFNMGGMASAVENVSAKFLALGTIAITTLANITNRAVDAGINLIKSLSLDPVMDGFREMETNMNSIQTILANTDSKGTTLDDVNEALALLNTYSDQTIYNFGEMARNIGTFTAAGIDLDTSVNSIKGIANIAAISGSNSQQAATAMYQLSQALATGSVKLMDWNSVVNAGMGGEVFQKALFETGKALGTIADTPIDTTFDQWKDAGNSFRGSLEEGWLTAEVLTNTLQGFTGDLTAAQLTALGYTEQQAQEMLRLGALGKAAATEVKTLTQLLGTVREAVGSGWSKTFQIVFGDFEQAKELFTGLNNVIGGFIGRSADARNTLLQGWADMGGRQALIDGVSNAFKALTAVITPIKEAFREFFPPITIANLVALTKGFERFTEKLMISEGNAIRVKRIFEGVFAALEIGWTIVKETAKAIGELFSSASDGADGNKILAFLVRFANDIRELNDRLVEGGGIADFFAKLVSVIKDPLPFIDELKTKFQEFFKGIEFGSFDGLIEAFNRIKDAVSKFLDSLDSGVINKIRDFFGNLFGHFDPQTTNSMEGGVERLSNRFSALGGVLSKIWGVVTKVGDVFGWFFDRFIQAKDFVVSAVKTIGKAISGIGPAFLEFFKSEDFDKVLELAKIGIAGIFASGFKDIGKAANKAATDGFKFDLTGGALTGLTDMFKGITSTMPAITRSLDSLSGTLHAMQTKLKAEALQKIAIAIGILTASVVVLSMIDAEALAKAMSALAVGFGQLIGAMALLNTITSGPKGAASMSTLAAGMIALSTAILVLSVALKILSTLSWEEIGKGLVAVTVLLGALVIAMEGLPDSGAMVRAGIGMIAIAVALNILAVAMKIFATMSWEEMAKGLVGVSVGLAAIVAATNLMPKGMLAKGAALVAIGIALNLLAASMKIFATMSWKEMAKGLAGVAGGLVIIAGAMQLMPKHMLLNAAGILLVGIALNAIARAMKSIGGMSWTEIGKGLVGIAGALVILAAATNAMSGAILGAVAITLVSGSLMLLAEVMKEFAKMSLSELGKGLLGMAGVLIALGLTAGIISPLIPSLLALGAAMLLLGAGFALFGIGASAVAKAFEIIAEAGKAGIEILMLFIDELLVRLPALIQALGEGLAQMALEFLKQGPALVAAIGEIIVQLLQEVVDAAPKFGEALVALIIAGLDSIRKVIPDVIATGVEVLLGFLSGIRDNIGEITIIVAEIITEFLTTLASKAQDLITAGATLLVEFLTGISENLADVVAAALEIVVQLLNGIAQKVDDVVAAGLGIVVSVIEGITKGTVDIIRAGKDMIIDIITGMGNAATEVAAAAADTIVAFLGGLDDNIVMVVDAGFQFIIELLNGIADSIDENAPELRAAGRNIARAIVDGLTGGLTDFAGDAVDAGKNLAGKVVGAIKNPFGIFSPSKTMIETAGYIVAGLAVGLNNSTKAENSASDFGTRVSDKMKKALSQIPTAIEGLSDFNPVITPVLDLTTIKNEARQLDGIIGGVPILSTDLSFGQARFISSNTGIREDESTSDETIKVPAEIKFEQNNYSPEALSTADIYRQTRNQLALAKEELAVL